MDPIKIVYDEDTSRNWSENPEINYLYLRTLENWANDQLKAQGFLFLNEVLSSIGIPRIKQGQLVGWVRSDDTRVSFGFWGEKKDPMAEGGSIDLKFNVDGVIIDQIDW